MANSSATTEESPLETINERLGQLRPSRELLEYLRKKIADYDNEQDELTTKLDRYKTMHRTA
eukprot:m.115620 g.115620  ORF g.115620 m.115620 type:complete len:62 (+) comp37553_c0_seq2:35-220(+)